MFDEDRVRKQGENIIFTCEIILREVQIVEHVLAHVGHAEIMSDATVAVRWNVVGQRQIHVVEHCLHSKRVVVVRVRRVVTADVH